MGGRGVAPQLLKNVSEAETLLRLAVQADPLSAQVTWSAKGVAGTGTGTGKEKTERLFFAI